MAVLLAVVTFAISAYYLQLMPDAFVHLIPANIGVLLSVFFWIKVPSKRKQRWLAALASLAVVPFMFSSAVLSLLTAPIKNWPVFLALTCLAFMNAAWALIRVKRKQTHPWSGYYREVA
jgi:uncharacterized membrane protein